MRGEIDPKHAAAVGVIGQRDSGADTDLENSSANAFAGSYRCPSAPFKYRAEHQIIDGRPSRIDLRDSISVDIGGHHVSRSSPISGQHLRWRRNARHEHVARRPAALSGHAHSACVARPLGLLSDKNALNFYAKAMTL